MKNRETGCSPFAFSHGGITGRYCFYAVIGIILTVLALHPIIPRMGTHFLGERQFETYTTLILLDWFRDAFFEESQSPIFSSRISYPIGFNYGLSDSWFPLILASVFVHLTGLTLGYNISLFVFVFLSFLACSLLMKEFGDHPGAVLLGAIVATANSITAYALYYDNSLYTTLTVFISIGMLLSLKLTKGVSRRPLLLAIALGVVLLLAFMTCYYHLFMLFFFCLFLSGRTAFSGKQKKKIFTGILLSGGVFLVGILIWIAVFTHFPGGQELIWHYYQFGRYHEWTQFKEKQVFLKNFSLLIGADKDHKPAMAPGSKLIMFKNVTPLVNTLIPGKNLYIGWSLLICVCTALFIRLKRNLFYFLTGFFFFLLALGPKLGLGSYVLNNPLTVIIKWFPGLSQLCVTNKYLLMTFLCWGILITGFFTHIFSSGRKAVRVAGYILAAALALESLGVLFLPRTYTFTITPNEADIVIRDDPLPGAVFDLTHFNCHHMKYNLGPFNTGSTPDLATEFDMGPIEQIFHGKPVVGISFANGTAMMTFPPILFSAVIKEQCYKAWIREDNPTDFDAYRASVLKLWKGFNIKYIKFHRYTFSRVNANVFGKMLQKLFGEPLVDDGRVLLFRVFETQDEDNNLLSPEQRARFFDPKEMWPLVSETNGYEDLASKLLEKMMDK